MAYRQPNEMNKTILGHQLKHEQMTKQQQLIEQKKLEIQKKLDEKKKKEIEEALKKLSDDKLKSSEPSRSKRNYHGYSKSKNWSVKEKPVVEHPSALPANIFSNDGSFLEQFQKLSGVKVNPRKKVQESIIHEKPDSHNGSETINQDSKPEEKTQKSEAIQSLEVPNKRRERRWSSPEKNLGSRDATTNQMQQPDSQYQPILHHQQQQMIIQQQQPITSQPNIQNLRPTLQGPPMQPQMFAPPHPMQNQGPSPHMPMNYPPQFNPMQCGMMLPPPMTPSSIPPPAPLNPNSIPSPSPLQPYSIPPPSPLMPHSIPPPRPMVPHSIPPPSPITPHSIPPPLPLRPQNIPPPMQRPPMFLSMVLPPPPPPPQEEESKPKPFSKPSEKECRNSQEYDLVLKNERSRKTKHNIEDNVKELFRNDEYSSSDEEEKNSRYSPGKNYSDHFESKKEEKYSPDKDYNYHSDSDTEPEQKSPKTSCNKESDGESYQKLDSLSGMGSEFGHDSQFAMNRNEKNMKLISYSPIVIEDTQTQFPSIAKESSNTGEAAPTDASSGGESMSHTPGCRLNNASEEHRTLPNFWQENVKQEPIDMFYGGYENILPLKIENINSEEKQEFPIAESFEIKSDVKQEEASALVSTHDDPPLKKKRRSRWASEEDKVVVPPPGLVVPPPPSTGPPGIVVPTALGAITTIVPPSVPTLNIPGMSGAMISKVTRTDPALTAYAMKAFGRTNLTPEEWKKAEDHFKINLLYQDMMRKKEELERLQAAGRNKYEYDSDEETEGGTWEHKLRSAEMEATQKWADELTEQAKGKHHIGDFLPPDELARFMEKYEALKEGREPDLSDYKEFKLKEDNVGFQMLQKMGWTDGQGLGPDGSGIQDPVNKATMRVENQGLGMDRPDDVDGGDDEYDAYRKRMMLAYRFRPNPMNNPRRPYY